MLDGASGLGVQLRPEMLARPDLQRRVSTTTEA
jgi:hypothetical protein